MIKLVVLNLESIIFFEKEAVNTAFLAAFAHFDYNLTQSELHQVNHQPFALAIETLLSSQGIHLASISENYLKRICNVFWEKLLNPLLMPFQVLTSPNIEELFSNLQRNNIKIALYSNFSPKITQLMIKSLKWQNEFFGKNIFCTEVQVNNLTPYFSIFHIMQLHEIKSAKEVAKIGTTPSEIRMANGAGCGYVIGMSKLPTVLQKLKQENCTHLIKHSEELYDIFKLEYITYIV